MNYKRFLLSIFGIVLISLFFQNVSAGCVGATYDFGCGTTINQSCTLNGNMNCVGFNNGLIIGVSNIILDGNGYTLSFGNATTGHGIYMSTKQNNTIKGFTILNNATGTTASYSYYDYNGDNNTVFNNTMIAGNGLSSKHVLVLSSSENNNISFNTVKSTSSSTGIYVSSSSHSNYLEGNKINTTSKSGYPLYIHTSSHTMIINNYIYSDYEVPILFYTTGVGHYNATLSGNKIYVNGAWKDIYFNQSISNTEIANIDFVDYGLVMCIQCSNVTYRNNTFRNHGMSVSNIANTPLFIINNLFLGNNSANIFGFYYDNITIFNNTFVVNETNNALGYKYGIDLRQPSDYNISNNNISTYGNNDYGIQVTSGVLGVNNYIDDNLIYTNHTNAMGMYLVGTRGIKLNRNNIIIDNQGYCIYLYSSGYNVIIQNNSCYLFGDVSNSVRGVTIYYNMINVSILDNYFESNCGVSTSSYFILLQRNVSYVNIDRNVFNFTGNNYNKIGIYNYDNVNDSRYAGAGVNISVNDNVMYGNTSNASTAYAYIQSFNATGMTIRNLTINHYNGGLDVFRGYTSTVPVIIQMDIYDSVINRYGARYGESYDIQFDSNNLLFDSWINLTNVTFNEGYVYWYNNATAVINVKNYLDVKVNYSNGTNIENAQVEGYWENNTLLFNKTTNSTGDIQRQTLDYYKQNYSTRTNYSNYKINTSVNGKTDDEVFNITTSILKWLTIIADSCSPPTSGDWIINCSDNCLINSAINIPANIILSGSGELAILNWNNLIWTGTKQYIALFSGCKIVLY